MKTLLLSTTLAALCQEVAVVGVPHGRGAELEHRLLADCGDETITFAWGEESLVVQRQGGSITLDRQSSMVRDVFTSGRPVAYAIECNSDDTITLEMFVTRRGAAIPTTQRAYAEFAIDATLLNYTGFQDEAPEQVNRHLE